MIKQRNGQPVPRGRHSAEIKVLAERVGVTSAALQLGIYESEPCHWPRKAR